MSEWRTYRISEVAEVFDGPHATPAKTNHGPWFLSISSLRGGRLDISESAHLSEEDFVRWTRRVAPEEGDLLFSYETRLGEAALMPAGVRACLGRRMGLLRPKRNVVDPRFLLYAYLGSEFQETISKHTVYGATVDRIPLVDLPRWPIRLPEDIREQQAIARLLGALDDKIAVNELIDKTCAELSSALFARHVWDYELLSELPEGYEFGSIGDLCERIGNGGTPKRMIEEYWRPGTIPWFKTGELSDGPLLGSKERISEKGLANSSCSVWPAGTVLVALYASPTVGRLGVLESDGTFNQACSALVAKAGVGSYVLFETLKATRSRLQNIAVGAAQQNISQAVLRAHRVVIPSREAASQFHQAADALHRKRVAALRQNIALIELRDTLLPKLISGGLRIKNAERQFSDAV